MGHVKAQQWSPARQPRMIIDISKRGVRTSQLRHSPILYADGIGSDDDAVFHVKFDGEEDQASQVIVKAVAAIRDKHPQELQPLAEVIDPVLLNSMVKQGAGSPGQEGGFTFVYEEIEVSLSTDGHVWLERV